MADSLGEDDASKISSTLWIKTIRKGHHGRASVAMAIRVGGRCFLIQQGPPWWREHPLWLPWARRGQNLSAGWQCSLGSARCPNCLHFQLPLYFLHVVDSQNQSYKLISRYARRRTYPRREQCYSQ